MPYGVRVHTLGQVNAAFAGDRGEPDPGVRAAIAASDGTVTRYLDAVAELCTARLLVPVVATGDDSGDGPDPARHAELAAVSVQGPDGRRALLAFTGLDALRAWEPRARPVPGTLDDVCATVDEAGAEALLIDVAGPVPFVVESDLVGELAQGRRLVRLDDGGYGWLAVRRDPPREPSDSA